jgi:glycerophosphoryl diester phosphodiesterase
MVFDRAAGSHARKLVIGHRGAAGLVPENTLPSFARAVELDVAAVELDVYALEGTLVVIHDATLERTTNGTGPVAACSLADLRRLDAGRGARVPLLEEVFELVPAEVGINVELKGKGTAELLAGFLRGYSERDVLVSSFDHAALEKFHRSSPQVPVAPLFSRWQRNVWRIADELNAWSVNLSLRIATRQRALEAREKGYRVLVYTVNDLSIAQQLAADGIDGIFTDYPDVIRTASLAGPTPC